MGESTSAKRRRLATYVPLKVTARLRSGVISDGLLPLDAILYYAAHREALAGRARVTKPRERLGAEDATIVGALPVRRIATHGRPDFYYAASCAQWPETVADGVDYWTKRIDTQHLDVLDVPRARIPLATGPYRAYRVPLAYRHALQVSWYVCGEPTAITRLLSLVSHIGKKASMGWGAVIDWSVEPIEHDWSVTGPHGETMRPVPDPSGVLYGVRPPYWLPHHQVPCRLPDGMYRAPGL